MSQQLVEHSLWGDYQVLPDCIDQPEGFRQKTCKCSIWCSTVNKEGWEQSTESLYVNIHFLIHIYIYICMYIYIYTTIHKYRQIYFYEFANQCLIHYLHRRSFNVHMISLSSIQLFYMSYIHRSWCMAPQAFADSYAARSRGSFTAAGEGMTNRQGELLGHLGFNGR